MPVTPTVAFPKRGKCMNQSANCRKRSGVTLLYISNLKTKLWRPNAILRIIRLAFGLVVVSSMKVITASQRVNCSDLEPSGALYSTVVGCPFFWGPQSQLFAPRRKKRHWALQRSTIGDNQSRRQTISDLSSKTTKPPAFMKSIVPQSFRVKKANIRPYLEIKKFDERILTMPGYSIVVLGFGGRCLLSEGRRTARWIRLRRKHERGGGGVGGTVGRVNLLADAGDDDVSNKASNAPTAESSRRGRTKTGVSGGVGQGSRTRISSKPDDRYIPAECGSRAALNSCMAPREPLDRWATTTAVRQLLSREHPAGGAGGPPSKRKSPSI
jgi:hypothetical protein